MSNYLIFKKPESNIHYAFGLFRQLQDLGYSEGPLNPFENFIIITKLKKSFRSSSKEKPGITAIDITSNYFEIVNEFIKGK
jgi:hypothetical protein